MLRILILALCLSLCSLYPADAKTKRSRAQVNAFLEMHGYEKTPEGYEVDHIIPLCAGGPDTPENMQLLTIEAHREKTKNDLRLCRELKKKAEDSFSPWRFLILGLPF